VLLRHVRDGISLPKVAEQWPFESATKRSKDAIKWRWKKVLKTRRSRLICGSCDERDEPETQLNSTEVSLQVQPWVEDQRDTRRCPQSNKSIECQLRRLQNVTPLVRDAHHKSRCDPDARGSVSVPAARHLDADRLDPRSTAAVRADRLDSRRRKGASLTLLAYTRA